jgi:hypothetical protein
MEKEVGDKCFTFWRFNTDLLEFLSLLHRPYYGFHKLFNLLVQASNIGVLLSRLLVHFHRLHTAVIFGREGIQNKIRILIDTDKITRSELLVVDQTDEREEDGLSGGGLDDGGFPNTCGVKVDISTFFSCLCLNIKI